MTKSKPNIHILEPVSYTHLDVYKRQEQAEGKNQNLADKQITLAGGGTLKFTILTSGGYGVQIQSKGVNVLLNKMCIRDS